MRLDVRLLRKDGGRFQLYLRQKGVDQDAYDKKASRTVTTNSGRDPKPRCKPPPAAFCVKKDRFL